MDELPISSES